MEGFGTAFLAFPHQEELPPRGDGGRLPPCKLHSAVLSLECRGPEGVQGPGVTGTHQTCPCLPFISVAAHPRDGHTSGCRESLAGVPVPSHPLPQHKVFKEIMSGAGWSPLQDTRTSQVFRPNWSPVTLGEEARQAGGTCVRSETEARASDNRTAALFLQDKPMPLRDLSQSLSLVLCLTFLLFFTFL